MRFSHPDNVLLYPNIIYLDLVGMKQNGS